MSSASETKRISWEEYALELAKTASKRSEDPYVKTGACALRYDHSVAGLGYNGCPSGVTIDWSNRDERRKRVIHSEINCLSYCKPGEVAILACNLLPCRHCMQTIGAYKIPTVVFEQIYDKDDFALTLAKEFNINLIQLNKKKESLWKKPMAGFPKFNIRISESTPVNDEGKIDEHF